MQNSKLKTLLVYKYLLKYSDENNPLTASDLIKLSQADGIKAERKSIYSDIEAIRLAGTKVARKEHSGRGYYIASRAFEPPEIRLLIDAVDSAVFITPGKTKSLSERLKSLVSSNQAAALSSGVYRAAVNKCENEDIYNIIDTLDEAIHNNKIAKFKYKTRNIDLKNKKSFTLKTFSVSPYALLWNNDKYYLVCNKAGYNNLMNLRLDRISKNVTVLSSPARLTAKPARQNIILLLRLNMQLCLLGNLVLAGLMDM
ncbi:MAG: WYL domain-containing protein [Clostridiales bacterium]|nr:WYL domain-containing protein [Clostridiales bacterium]